MRTPHGDLNLPVFLPDATRAVVRALDSVDVRQCGIEAVMVNTLHLSSHPGLSTVQNAGGIHSFMGWDAPVMSDSGGYQVFSLLAQTPKAGSVTTRGFTYHLGGRKRRLTPESCIRKQLKMRADVLFCLDHCTHPSADFSTQRQSVENTVRWARAGKHIFESMLEQREEAGVKSHPVGTAAGVRPLLFAVVQGGSHEELRRECAQRLLEIGFDGYGYGGWPINDTGGLMESVSLTAELIPSEITMHGLGIGKPNNLVRAFQLGYDSFDCVIPTRDARHRRLYAFTDSLDKVCLDNADFFRQIYIDDERHAKQKGPVDRSCDCLCCRRYSMSYLRHLFQIGDASAARLATIHNLRFYSRLMDILRYRF